MATVVMLAVSVFPIVASASDYSHTCRTGDGQYEMNDEQLTRTGESAEITYENLGETIVKHVIGYCVSKQRPGTHFGFESKSYVLQIRFVDHGQTITTSAMCELASSGLPAMYSCDREVITSETGSRAKPTGIGAGRWNHNGSTMALRVDGARRAFVYERPRAGVRAAGARPGTVLFEGRREGDTYVGTATVFSKRCGPQSYTVSGPVARNERRVTLFGDVPLIGKDCRITKRTRDRLDFTLINDED